MADFEATSNGVKTAIRVNVSDNIGDLDELTRGAEDIGMSINEKKTQLLVVSPPNGCKTTAAIATRNGSEILSSQTLKLVRFTFGSDPGAGAHVDSIADRYAKKEVDATPPKGQHLYKLYCCYIRSIIEYGSPVYHSLLNGAQELRLERLQRHALRVCFGYHRPIEEVMGEFGISTLKDRRGRRCDNFIRKAAKNPRFADAWFPEASHPLQPEKQKTRAGNSSKFGEALQITASLPQTEGQRVGERPGQLGMERVMEESADRSGAPGWSGVQGYSASRCSVSFRIIYEYILESGIICYCY